jgi:hypothetical protein
MAVAASDDGCEAQQAAMTHRPCVPLISPLS